MPGSPPHRRAVLLARGESVQLLSRLFSQPELRSWELMPAEGLEHARFLVALGACEVLLLDSSFVEHLEEGDLTWLTRKGRAVVVLLHDNDEKQILFTLHHGVRHGPVRASMLQKPALLAEVLNCACLPVADVSREQALRRQLRKYRRQVHRLSELLWLSLPFDGRAGWLSQRFMLTRLHQELMLCERHHTPLAVIVGEWALPSQGSAGNELEKCMREWTIDRVLENKRRSDVAGQYGPRGFLLLLPQTTEAGGRQFGRRLQVDLSRQPLPLSEPWRLSTAVGVTGYSPDRKTPQSLLRHAEEQLILGRRNAVVAR